MTLDTALVLLLFLTFAALLFSGYPVAWLLGGLGVVMAAVCAAANHFGNTDLGVDFQALGLIVNRTYKLMDNGVLVALPMFVFMGLMLDRSGIAERLMHAVQELFGSLRGGLAVTVTMIGVLLAASTGIIGASVVLLGVLSIPAMLRQGYARHFAVGTVCGAGCLGILIPPSIMLVIMADQLMIPVGDLFMGAVLPGLLLAGLYVTYILAYALLYPKSAPLPANRRPFSPGMLLDVGKTAVPPLLLIVLVLGSIFCGIATPTEASGVGAFGATLLAAWNRRLDLDCLRQVSRDCLRTTAFILAILIGASCFSVVLRLLGGDELIASALGNLPFSPHTVVVLLLAVVFVLGFFLDWIEITMIVLPLVAPVVSSLGLGINGFGSLDNADVVWFTILVAMALQTSFLTPPVGFALFYVKGVCPPEVSVGDLYRGVVPFICLQLLALLILILWPALVTWLPAVAY